MIFISLLKYSRLFLSLFIIVWITPQTSITYYNYVLNTMHSTRLFSDYPAAKTFVGRVTWFCIISYMIINFLLFFKGQHANKEWLCLYKVFAL